MENVLEIGVKTTVPLYRVSFRWEFENCSKLPGIWSEKSQEFSVEPESSWYVKFIKNFEEIWLYICRTKGNNLKASCEALILNYKDEALHKNNLNYKSSREVDVFPDSDYNVLGNLPEDKVTFKILINVENPKPSTVYVNQPHIPAEVSVNPLKTLSGDLKKLFVNNIKTDVTFNIGSETLSAHKNILVARSEVFAKMFQKGMTEEDNSVVNIEDIDLTAMKTLLCFMYSAELEECDVDRVLEVYRAADKYAVPDLMEACAYTLAAKMTMQNVSKIIYFADMNEEQELKDQAMQFIAVNHGVKQRKP